MATSMGDSPIMYGSNSEGFNHVQLPLHPHRLFPYHFRQRLLALPLPLLAWVSWYLFLTVVHLRLNFAQNFL
jgi:hypothetical protein